MTGPRLSIIPARACTDPDLKPRDLQVLCLFGRHGNDDGWCSRSQVKMARELNCARSTVQAAINRLVDQGYLDLRVQKTPHIPGERDCPHEYRVKLDTETTSTPADISAPPADPEPAPPADSRSAPKNDYLRTTDIFTGARETKKETVRGNLETILSAEMAEEVIQHRRRIGKAMTPFAAKRLAAKFAQTVNPDESAAAMIEHGWQGFEPAWLENRKGKSGESKAVKMIESFARAGQQ